MNDVPFLLQSEPYRHGSGVLSPLSDEAVRIHLSMCPWLGLCIQLFSGERGILCGSVQQSAQHSN